MVDERGPVTATESRFTGKVALVTGGGSGIGRATALAFARGGATVVVAGRTEESLRRTVQCIEDGGGRASAVVADVTRPDDVPRIVGTTVVRHGGLHVACNSAGVLGDLEPVAELDDETWTHVLAANLTGVWLSMRHEIEHMRANGGGTIVNVASIAGTRVAWPGHGAYAAAKAGVDALTRVAAKEYIADGVRINAISPGLVDTPMLRLPGDSEAERNAVVSQIVPAGRLATPEEIAGAVVWLASPDAGFVVGHNLVVDGGVSG